MIEGDFAADRRQRRAARTNRRLRTGVEDIAKPFDGKTRLVEVLPDLGEPQHRNAYAAGQHVEGDEFANGQVSLDDELGAEEQDGDGNQLAHELDGLARHIAETEDAEAGRHIGGELLVPATLHLWFDSHGLQRLDAGDAFDEESLVLGPALKFFVEASSEK